MLNADQHPICVPHDSLDLKFCDLQKKWHTTVDGKNPAPVYPMIYCNYVIYKVLYIPVAT